MSEWVGDDVPASLIQAAATSFAAVLDTMVGGFSEAA